MFIKDIKDVHKSIHSKFICNSPPSLNTYLHLSQVQIQEKLIYYISNQNSNSEGIAKGYGREGGLDC